MSNCPNLFGKAYFPSSDQNNLSTQAYIQVLQRLKVFRLSVMSIQNRALLKIRILFDSALRTKGMLRQNTKHKPVPFQMDCRPNSQVQKMFCYETSLHWCLLGDGHGA